MCQLLLWQSPRKSHSEDGLPHYHYFFLSFTTKFITLLETGFLPFHFQLSIHNLNHLIT